MSSVASPHAKLSPGYCGCSEVDACAIDIAVAETINEQAPSADPSFKSKVLQVAAASSIAAFEHYSRKLQFETDCSDVHSAFASGTVDFVLLDVRSAELYRNGHLQGAINVPVQSISESGMAEFPLNTIFVVYCAGPYCNGANKAAMRLSRLGRPVKEMIGGVTGWLDEGLTLEKEC